MGNKPSKSKRSASTTAKVSVSTPSQDHDYKIKSIPMNVASNYKSIDLTIFEASQYNRDCTDYKSCITIKRILTFLKYVSLLRIKSNKE